MTLKKTASFVTLLLLMWTASAANAQDLRTGTLKSVVGEVSLVNSDGARSAQTGGGVLQADQSAWQGARFTLLLPALK